MNKNFLSESIHAIQTTKEPIFQWVQQNALPLGIMLFIVIIVLILNLFRKKNKSKKSISSIAPIKQKKEEDEDETAFEKLNEFIEKADVMKRKDKMDLSSDQDLTIAIMNLISIEEHFFFSGAKTGKSDYYNLIEEVREIRKNLLKKIIKEYEGEVWCISKHLLAASMRIMECGTKQLSIGNKQEAYELFQKAYDLYCLFWGVNMKIIGTSDLKKIDDAVLNKDDKSKKGTMKKLGELVRTVINCCIE